MKTNKIVNTDLIALIFAPIICKIIDLFRQEKWEGYDPKWLVDLAKEQYPNDKEIRIALENCKKSFGKIPYIHFVSPKRANKPGSKWQFEKNITLEHPLHGELILDILKDGKVGGVEFLGELLKNK